MAPIRGSRGQQTVIPESVLLPYVRDAAPQIAQFYSLYSDDLRPLSNVTSIPEDLAAIARPNGDIVLCGSDGQEVFFDVVGVVIECCLEAPIGFAKSRFPFFCRWIKLCAVGDPAFDAALRGSQALYTFLTLHVTNVLPPPLFFAGGAQCFRPSATMLTSRETVPDATAVDLPPLDNPSRIEAAVRASHGKYLFSSDNEVLYFSDQVVPTGEFVRREIGPTGVRVGQFAQLRMGFRLLKQENGSFVFRELLKGVNVLHAGFSAELVRQVASQCVGNHQRHNRDAKFYNSPRNNAHGTSRQTSMGRSTSD